MISEDYTLGNYIEEIKPMVEQIRSDHAEELMIRFEASLHELKIEAMRCDDTFNIYQSWRSGIATSLNLRYGEEELLEIHGRAGGRIKEEGGHYTANSATQPALEFYLCEHMIYTPVTSENSIHQCLRC